MLAVFVEHGDHRQLFVAQQLPALVGSAAEADLRIAALHPRHAYIDGPTSVRLVAGGDAPCVRGRVQLGVITLHLVEPWRSKNHIEQELLARVAQGDESARRVYADALEERGAIAEAAWVLFDYLLHTTGLEPDQLGELAAEASLAFKAEVSRAPIENCRMGVMFRCPGAWHKLSPVAVPGVRRCQECQRDVYFCDSVATARRHARYSQQVALEPALPRRPNDLF